VEARGKGKVKREEGIMPRVSRFERKRALIMPAWCE